MAEALLQQRFDEVDCLGAAHALQSVFGTTVSHAGSSRSLAYRQHSIVDDGISVSTIVSSGGALRVRIRDAAELVVIAVRTGQVDVQVGPEAISRRSGEISLLPMAAPLELRWNRASLIAFSFTRTAIGRFLDSPAQSMRLQYARITPRSAAVAELWRRTAAVLSDGVLTHPDLYTSDVIRDSAIDALLGVTIEAFGISNMMEEPASDVDVLSRAEAFMRERLGESISVGDVARATGISVRGLQMAFQRHGRGTPMLRLRQLRLTAARRAFEAPAVGRPPTVGSVANTLGYTNVSRFSMHYRDAHGETPSETLRAAR